MSSISPPTSGNSSHAILTDLTVIFCSSPNDPRSTSSPQSPEWHRIPKDLYLHSTQKSAWLEAAYIEEKALTADGLVVTGIRVGEEPSRDDDNDDTWESRPGGIWVRRSKYTNDCNHATITGVDVLFGVDAVDPRPQWTLIGPPLQMDAPLQENVPVARLTVRHGRAIPIHPPPPLRTKKDGTFKIVQIADTHMVAGVGTCTDAIDAHGRPLPDSEADPLTVLFLGQVLDAEKPDLVVFTGDQLHHGILDSQSALFKVVAPVVERSIPFASVFGNHDDEGPYALSREEQMSLLQNLPFSLCDPGREDVDGVGNHYLQITGPSPSSHLPLLTLFLLDSHGEIQTEIKKPDYNCITQGQIDWFTRTSQDLRRAREKDDDNNNPHVSLAFIHIPIPEYADDNLVLKAGHRGEPTEGPGFNSHFYDALASEGVAALGCGHDHVNDFCALRPLQAPPRPKDGGDDAAVDKKPQIGGGGGPWLCYAGGSGFGAYCSWGGKRYHRRTRVWEFDANTASVKTWKRVEYATERVDELVLVERGGVVSHV